MTSQNAIATSKMISGIEVSQTTIPLTGNMLLKAKTGITSNEPITPNHAIGAGIVRPFRKRYAKSVLPTAKIVAPAGIADAGRPQQSLHA